MLNQKKVDTLLMDNTLRAVTVTAGTTTAGAIQILGITFFYNDNLAFANGRIGLQNVGLNVRPAITITVPEDMPTFDIQGGNAIRGSAGSTQPTDCAHITHTKGDDKAYINFYNYIGQSPAGFILATF